MFAKRKKLSTKPAAGATPGGPALSTVTRSTELPPHTASATGQPTPATKPRFSCARLTREARCINQLPLPEAVSHSSTCAEGQRAAGSPLLSEAPGCEKTPAGQSAALRRLSTSASPTRQLSASAAMPPGVKRTAARPARALRCTHGGFRGRSGDAPPPPTQRSFVLGAPPARRGGLTALCRTAPATQSGARSLPPPSASLIRRPGPARSRREPASLQTPGTTVAASHST